MPLLRAVSTGLCAAAVLALALSAAHAEDPFYKGKRLTLLINFAAGGPTDIEGRLLVKHIAKHLDGQPQHHRAEQGRRRRPRGRHLYRRGRPKDGTMFGYVTAVAWHYVIDPESLPRRLQELRVHRLSARQRRLLRAHRRRRRASSSTPTSSRRKDLVAGGLAAELLEGPADPPDSSTCSACRTSYVTGYRSSDRGAARAAARRDQFLLGDDARLFQRRRAEHGEDRAR